MPERVSEDEFGGRRERPTLPEGSVGIREASEDEGPGWIKRFEAALIRGDEKECRRVLILWYRKYGSFASVADGLIAPTFRRLGEAWHTGRIEIFQERRGCEICARLVHEFRRLITEPSTTAPLAIGGSAAHDNYSLPGQLIEVVFRECGWRAMNLGHNLPLSSLLHAVKQERPKIVWLSVSFIMDRIDFVNQFAEFSRSIPKETSLVVGGRELNDEVRPLLNYGAYCDNLQQLASLAKSMKGSSFASASSSKI